jgi:hypothetical protein
VITYFASTRKQAKKDVQDAWDSYIQSSAVDPNSNNLWPGMNVDLPTPGQMLGPDGSSLENQQQQQTAGAQNNFLGSGNVFMGAGLR